MSIYTNIKINRLLKILNNFDKLQIYGYKQYEWPITKISLSKSFIKPYLLQITKRVLYKITNRHAEEYRELQ